MSLDWMLCLISAGIFSLVGAQLGQHRGRAYEGCILGLCLGPLGILIVAFLDDKRARCHHCRSPLLEPSAPVCAACGRDANKLGASLAVRTPPKPLR